MPCNHNPKNFSNLLKRDCYEMKYWGFLALKRAQSQLEASPGHVTCNQISRDLTSLALSVMADLGALESLFRVRNGGRKDVSSCDDKSQHF